MAESVGWKRVQVDESTRARTLRERFSRLVGTAVGMECPMGAPSWDAAAIEASAAGDLRPGIRACNCSSSSSGEGSTTLIAITGARIVEPTTVVAATASFFLRLGGVM